MMGGTRGPLARHTFRVRNSPPRPLNPRAELRTVKIGAKIAKIGAKIAKIGAKMVPRYLLCFKNGIVKIGAKIAKIGAKIAKIGARRGWNLRPKCGARGAA